MGDIEANFKVPGVDVQTGTYGRIELKATMQSASPEQVMFSTEITKHVEVVQDEIDESVTAVVEQISQDVTSRLGYRFHVNTQDVDRYTLKLDDEGNLVRMTASSENEVVVPTNEQVAFEVGTIINIRQAGFGRTLIEPASGVRINAPEDSKHSDGKDLGISLVKVDTNEWDLVKSFVGIPLEDVEGLLGEIQNSFGELELQQRQTETLIADTREEINEGIQDEIKDMEAYIEQNIGDVVKTGEFEAQKTEDGYMKFPGGMTIQWGQAGYSGRHGSHEFPVMFDNACLVVVGTPRYSANSIGGRNLHIKNWSTGSFSYAARSYERPFGYIAIGY